MKRTFIGNTLNFVEFLTSKEGKAIFIQHWFTTYPDNYYETI
jgi:hypothetical protein